MVGSAAALCLGLSGLLDVGGVALPGAVTHFAGTLRVTASALFLGAGVLRVSRWRISGDTRNALMGVALIVLGGTAIPFAAIAAAVAGSRPGSLHEPLTRAVATVVILTLATRALTAPPEAPQPPTIWLMMGALAISGGGFLGVLALNRWACDALYAGRGARAGLELSMAAAWIAVSVMAWLRHGRHTWTGRAAPLLGAMGLVATMRGIAVYRNGAFDLASAVLATVISCIVVYCALIDLVDTTVTEHSHLQSVVEGQRSWREQFSHDARNSLAGLRATLTTLDRYDGRLNQETLATLRSAAIGEISHLDHLIVRSEMTELVDFWVEDVVRSVVDTRRATGLQVRLTTGNERVHGVPGDLATALQNLLVNAQEHAPGQIVAVRTERTHGLLEIRVRDHGPGIHPTAVDGVFDRGTRGPGSGGSGLGLYVARELMRNQGGDLRLISYADGCEFALSIPLVRADVVHLPAQRVGEARLVVEPT